MEGNIITEHLEQIQLLHEWVSASHDAVTALQNNLPKAAKFVTAALMLAVCVGKCSELTQKTSQLMAMKEEHKRASERLTQVRAMLFTDSDLASIDAAAVRRLRNEALDLQIATSRPLAVMSLNLCEDSEERALDVICKLPLAKRVIKVLRNPACVAEFVGELDLSATQVRCIQTRLRDAETKTAADELQAAWSASLESLKQAKLTEVSRQEKADKRKETPARKAAASAASGKLSDKGKAKYKVSGAKEASDGSSQASDGSTPSCASSASSSSQEEEEEAENQGDFEEEDDEEDEEEAEEESGVSQLPRILHTSSGSILSTAEAGLFCFVSAVTNAALTKLQVIRVWRSQSLY